MVPFAELHCHSSFSFLDGASEAYDLVEEALALGLSALAVTDHQGLYGAVRFTTAAREAGLHPVVGIEVELLDPAVPDPGQIVVPRRRRTRSVVPAEPVTPLEGRPSVPASERARPPGHREPRREDLRGVRSRELGPHLVLLAQDTSGYRSLCRLSSAAHLAGTKGVPRFSHELLARHTEGLVALTGCRHGELSRRLLAGDREGALAAARRLRGWFGDRLQVELQHHLLPDDDWLVAELARLADELGLPTIVTNDVHYARPEDRELQDVLVCIRHGVTLEESAHLRRPNGQYHLKGEAALLALPPGLPGVDPLVARAWREGIARAGEVAAGCRVELEFEQYRFPGFEVPSGETPFSELARLCHEGARRRYHPLTPRVLKQMAHELEVIERTGLAEFFLICWDLMEFCRERGIPAQGRGSAGDSIVAYVLGITRVDPIRHELLFERFINEGRTSYPDVDIDFASSRREEVIQYVYERYGTEHTGMVCNVVTYRARSAVREVGYALGFPRPLVDRVAKALETYDSVMVRRDLEAEGGFAEFFQVPGGEAAAPAAGSSPAAGGSLPQAVAAAAATEAARVAGTRAAAFGFVDRMGELAAPKVAGVPREPPHLAPVTELRPGPSDDKGGPGDSVASVRWLRKEDERRALMASLTVLPGGREDAPPADPNGRSPEVLTASLTLAERGGNAVDGSGNAPKARESHLTGRNRAYEAGKPGAGSVLTPSSADDRPPGNTSGDDGRTAVGNRRPGAVTLDVADPPGTIEGRRIDPGTGVLLPAERPKRLGRDGAAPPGERRIVVSSMGGLELDPIPPRPRGSTVGLSPWDRWLELCARIDGFPRHLSIHVGGMLITAAPLVDIAPLEHATMPGRVVVQYDKRDVETIKLIKLDLLGLRMLSAIDDALRDIAVDCGVCVDLDRLPEDIPEVFRMIQAADTVGVFQIESRAQMQTLPRSRPETLDDLVVEVAIIRPGPIQGNAVHPYLRRKQGLEPVTYLHPSLEPALRETLGVILYQEQVMKIAIDVAGFSAAESDGFRRAMGTWRSRKEMEKLHARFVEGCMTANGLTPEQAEVLFSQVAGFASFGFNKSHAAAFARTAYESAFLKLFYPAHLTVGLINAQPMGFYPVEVLINDAKRHGVAVLPVDVNRSRFRTTTEWAGMPDEPIPEGAGIDRRPEPVRSPGCVVPDVETAERYAPTSVRGYGIRLGLHLVKGIGEAEGEALDVELARGGPYRSLADLVGRTELPEEIVERLVRAGALDSFGRARRELLWQLREVSSAARGRTDGRSIGSRKAQGRTLDLRLPPTPAPDLPPPTELERLGDAYAILSLDARRQVVELFRPALDRLQALPISGLDTHLPGRVAIGGLVVTRQHPMTAKGTVFLALEDETGMANVTLWPDTWARLRGVVRRHALLYVEGTLQRESRVVNLVARRIRPLTEVCRSEGGPDRPHGVRHMGHAGMRRQG
jgi:DNA polymerase III alpha subunit